MVVESKLSTRRAMLKTAAAGLAAAAVPAVPALAIGTASDPIFAAIEAHRRAYQAFSDAVLADEEWQTATHHASDTETDAAVELLNVKPTTLAGVAALLRYAYEHEKKGCEWPAALVDDDDTKVPIVASGHAWHYLMHRHLADALEQIAAST